MTRKIKKPVINVKPKRSRQGETEEQTQVEDQVEERTFHHQQGDGSQGTGDDANQEAREPHSTRRQRNTETGRR